MKNFTSRNELVSYIYSSMLQNDNSTAIVTYDMVEDIVDILKGCINIVNFSKEMDADCDEYQVTKYIIDENERTFGLIIETIEYNEDEELLNDIENDYVYLVVGILDDSAINAIVVNEEIEFLSLSENQKNECICESCKGCDEIKEELEFKECESEYYDELSEDQKEYIDLATQEIFEVLPCPEGIRNLLAEVFMQGFNSGSDTALLSLSDGLKEAVINRNID